MIALGYSRSPRKKVRHRGSFDDGLDTMDATDESEAEDSVIGASTRQSSFQETSNASLGFSRVELRLYSVRSFTAPDDSGSVNSFGAMFLTHDCTTAHDCFTRICDTIETDCNFMVFRLPEDMSREGSLRVNRRSTDAETVFQRVLEKFREAKKFPGEPQYRSVEVEIGVE
jgi:hypothetical protein